VTDDSRRRRTAMLAEAVLVVTLAVGAVGCSDASDDEQDQQSDVEAWAGQVCTSAAEWRSAIEDAQATLTDTDQLSADVLRSTVDDVASATESLVTDLGDLGAPDTEAGDEAAAQVSSLADQLREQEDVVATAIDQEGGSLQELLTQVSTVTGAIATMLGDIGTAIDEIRGLDGAEELEQAFETSPGCEGLGASPGA
jgi:hypothetical protein